MSYQGDFNDDDGADLSDTPAADDMGAGLDDAPAYDPNAGQIALATMNDWLGDIPGSIPLGDFSAPPASDPFTQAPGSFTATPVMMSFSSAPGYRPGDAAAAAMRDFLAPGPRDDAPVMPAAVPAPAVSDANAPVSGILGETGPVEGIVGEGFGEDKDNQAHAEASLNAAQSSAAPQTGGDTAIADAARSWAGAPSAPLDGAANVQLAVNGATDAPATAASGDPTAVVRHDLPGVSAPQYMQPDFTGKLDQLQAYAASKGYNLKFLSGYRSPEDQAQLRADYEKKKAQGLNTVKPAENSQHSVGTAVDMDNNSLRPGQRDDLIHYAQSIGMRSGKYFRGNTDANHLDNGLAANATPARIQAHTQNIKAFRAANPGQ